jgi:glycosyltransferase involved in cell wall biosynthesis
MKISVALCTYNGADYLIPQLNSIISQTLLPDEIVICDDGSTDNTIDIINAFIAKNEHITIWLYKNTMPLKTIKNFEKAITNCTGDWIFLCDQDDVWYPEKVNEMMTAVTPEALMIFSDGDLIDKDGNDSGATLWQNWYFTKEVKENWADNKNAFYDLLNGRNYVTGATAAISAKLKKNALPINVPSGYYHDAWFALHAAAQNGLRAIEKKLIKYRVHPMQQVGTTAGGKNVGSVLNKENISYPDFIRSIYKLYPQYKRSLSEKIMLRMTPHNLFRRLLSSWGNRKS